MRVVLDTNIIVSATISSHGFPARILRAWDEDVFELLVSSDLLAEYREVLGYERIRRRHGKNDTELNQLVAEYRHGGIEVEPAEAIAAIPNDPDDDRVLECAVTGNATHIVSGDPHLLALRKLSEYPDCHSARVYAGSIERQMLYDREFASEVSELIIACQFNSLNSISRSDPRNNPKAR